MKLALFFLLVFCLSMLPIKAKADDASHGVILPGMQSMPRGSIHVIAARVVLHAEQIAVSVTAHLAPDGLGHIVIHGPRFGWMGDGEPYADRQLPELRVSVDGTPAALANRFSAFIGSADISATLRDAQLDPFVIAETPPFVSAAAGHEIAFNELVALAAIRNSSDGFLDEWQAAREIEINIGVEESTRLD